MQALILIEVIFSTARCFFMAKTDQLRGITPQIIEQASKLRRTHIVGVEDNNDIRLKLTEEGVLVTLSSMGHQIAEVILKNAKS
jgi:hypothetical protein